MLTWGPIATPNRNVISVQWTCRIVSIAGAFLSPTHKLRVRQKIDWRSVRWNSLNDSVGHFIRSVQPAERERRCKPALCSNFAIVFSHSNNKSIAVAKKADRTAYDVRYGCGLVTLHRATLTRRQFTARQLIAATDSRVPFHRATLHRRPRVQHRN